MGWKKIGNGVSIIFTQGKEVITLDLIASPLKQKEILLLLDEYFYLLAPSKRNEKTEPYNKNPNILADWSLYEPVVQRIFMGRFGSRLEYMKAYYMERYGTNKITQANNLN